MKYFDIDLTGILTLQGNSPGDRQVIQYKEGQLGWATASAPLSNTTLKKDTSNNTIIVESVSNQIVNGDRLISAVSEAYNLTFLIGAGPNNRVKILLMPGTYDVYNADSGTGLNVNASFIDIKGISANPRSVVIKSSNGTQPQTIYFEGLDNGLENLHLKSPDGSSTAYNFASLSTSYLRFNNLVLSGNGQFIEDSNSCALSELTGEFTNIVSESGNQFCSDGLFDGVFDNIRIENNSYAFYSNGSRTISGTFSNLNLTGVTYSFHHKGVGAGFDIICDIKNSKFNGMREVIFKSGNNMDLKIKDTFVSGYAGGFISTATLNGIYEDLHISDLATNQTFFSGSPIDGIFKNIDFDNSSQSLFLYPTDEGLAPSISGTFSNISVAGTLTDMFCCNSSKGNTLININLKDLDVKGYVTNLLKNNYNGGFELFGSYKNVYVDSTTNGLNGDVISGNFENIKIHSTDGPVFTGGVISSSYFKDIFIKSTTANDFFVMSGDINGNFDNVQMRGTVSNFMQSSGNMYGSFKNFDIENVTSNIFVSQNGSNIQVDNLHIRSSDTGNYLLYSGSYIIGTFSNIRTNGYSNFILSSSTSYLDINVENLFFQQSDFVFYANAYILGYLKNIRGYRCFVYFLRSSGNHIFGTFEDISCIANGDTFRAGSSIIGTFSDISIYGTPTSFFQATTGVISGSYRDIYVPKTTTGFAFVNSGTFSGLMDNIKCGAVLGLTFGGRMYNSEFNDINSIGVPISISSNSGKLIIENSDFYVSGATPGGGLTTLFAMGSSVSNANIINVGTRRALPVNIIPITPNYNFTFSGTASSVKINSYDATL